MWAKFINAEEREDFAMIAEKDPYIKSAYNQLQIISQDKQKQLEYEAREKAIRDHNQLLFEAEQRGEERGEKRGMQRGIERGIECGMQRGIECGMQRGIERGMQRGIERICTLNNLLIQNNRYDDLARSANDTDFREKLFDEFGI